MDIKTITRTLDALEWQRVLELVAISCHTDRGREKSFSIIPANSFDEAVKLLEETKSCIEIHRSGISLPITLLEDLKPLLTRLSAEGILNASELLQIFKLLSISKDCLTTLKSLPQIPVPLFIYAKKLHPFDEERKVISKTITPQMKIADDASILLQKLRGESRNIEHSIRSKLDDLLNNRRISDALQDRYYTTREGRFVLPVKVDFQGRIDGIVHDTSGSGSTIFIEPRVVSELGNTLKVVYGKIAQEEERILKELSMLLFNKLNLINESWESVVDLDVIQAKAYYGKRFNASIPDFSQRTELNLIEARHPLLEADPSVKVIPNDISLGEGSFGLIVTGPNAGGKTVALKTTGVAILSINSGIPVLADSSSHIPWFKSIFANIGDWQSIAAHLSTFSAQIKGMVDIFGQAGKGSLVLLDEVVSATDPHEGAALAKALLEALVKNGAMLIVTTHYGELKSMAYEDKRFLNASMEFREDTLTPTYRLINGIPGMSNATEIAHRLGLPMQIIERARSLIGTRANTETALLRDLEEKRRKAEDLLRDAEIYKKRAAEEERIWRSELERFKREKRELLSEAKGEFDRKLREKEGEINKVIQELQKKPELKAAEVVRRRLGEIKRTLPRPPEEDEARSFKPITEWEEIRIGKNVWIESLGQTGILRSLPNEKGVVEVQVGAIKTRVPAEKISEAPKEKKVRKKTNITIHAETSAPTSIDLRGTNIEEATEKLDRFLNEAITSGHSQVVLIHGHGSGKLRDALRAILDNYKFVKTYRPGEQHEGGNGVTVITLHST